LRGARGVLINITGGNDLTLFELDEAANRIREEVDPEANIIVGSTMDPSMEGAIRVSVVATGIEAKAKVEPLPVAPTLTTPPAPAPVMTEDSGQISFIPQEDTVDRFEDDSSIPEPIYKSDETEQKVEDNNPAASFIAPQAPAPGTPSADMMARLKAAAGTANQTEAKAEVEDDEKAGFGINSLIGRMTGRQEVNASQRSAVLTQMSEAPQQFEEESDMSADDRAEIPAFLRRQAN